MTEGRVSCWRLGPWSCWRLTTRGRGRSPASLAGQDITKPLLSMPSLQELKPRIKEINTLAQ